MNSPLQTNKFDLMTKSSTNLIFPSYGKPPVTLQLSPVAYHIPWEIILMDLRSSFEENRWKAARELREHLRMAARELQTTQMAIITQDLHRRLFTLITSTDMTDRLAGMTAIHELVKAFVSSAIGVASATSSVQVTNSQMNEELGMIKPSMMISNVKASEILLIPTLENQITPDNLSLGVTEILLELWRNLLTMYDFFYLGMI